MALRKISLAYYYLNAKRLFHSVGFRSYIIKPMRITGGAYITIGDRVSILNQARIEVFDSNEEKMDNIRIKIGNRTNIEQNVHITAGESVIIGNDCSIMGYVTITDLIHPYNELNTPPKYQKMITKPVEIQDECMIGMGARIMPGVKLGKHCIVGANAVVTQDFDSYTVIAGVPARVIKRIV